MRLPDFDVKIDFDPVSEDKPHGKIPTLRGWGKALKLKGFSVPAPKRRSGGFPDFSVQAKPKGRRSPFASFARRENFFPKQSLSRKSSASPYSEKKNLYGSFHTAGKGYTRAVQPMFNPDCGYLRRCICRFNFKSAQKNENLLNARISLLTGKKVTKMSGSVYNSVYVDYVKRDEAALSGIPEYEEATNETPLYSVVSGEKVFLSGKDAAHMLKNSKTITLVVSPEDNGVNLTEFVSELMEKSIKKHFKGELYGWVAANHYNTSHPHAHVLMAVSTENKDKKEDKVESLSRITTSSIRTGLVQREAELILTDLMGKRNRIEELEYIGKKTSQDKVISEDFVIAKRAVNSDIGKVFRLDDQDNLPGRTRRLVKARLDYLESVGLVGKLRDGGYLLTSEASSDFIQAVRIREYAVALGIESGKAVSAIFDGDRNYKGKITATERDDTDDEKVIFAIEDEQGRLHLREEEILNSDYKERISDGVVDVSKLKEELEIGFDRISKERKHSL